MPDPLASSSTRCIHIMILMQSLLMAQLKKLIKSCYQIRNMSHRIEKLPYSRETRVSLANVYHLHVSFFRTWIFLLERPPSRKKTAGRINHPSSFLVRLGSSFWITSIVESTRWCDLGYDFIEFACLLYGGRSRWISTSGKVSSNHSHHLTDSLSHGFIRAD